MFTKKKVKPKNTSVNPRKSKVKPKHDTPPIKKPVTNVISQRVDSTPDKFGSGKIKSNIKPLKFIDVEPDKPIVKPQRKYPNQEAHPELQDINLSAGYHSALMKQLEIQEELTRALIDIQITGLPEAAKEEMRKKYGDLI